MERTQATLPLLGVLALAVAIIAAGAVLVVRADAQGAGYSSAPANTPAAMIVDIDANGNAVLRGTVVGTASGSMSLETWGGTWTIVGTNLPAVSYGNFIGVDGTVAASAPMTIDASYVRDWSTSSLVYGVNIPVTSFSGLAPGDALYTGVASNVGNDSFTLTQSGTGAHYTVYLTGNALVWNDASAGIPYMMIQNGDSVRLDGVASGYTITADVVRDVDR